MAFIAQRHGRTETAVQSWRWISRSRTEPVQIGCLQHFERLSPPGYHCRGIGGRKEKKRKECVSNNGADPYSKHEAQDGRAMHYVFGKQSQTDQEADRTLVKLWAGFLLPRIARCYLTPFDQLLDGLFVPLAISIQASGLCEFTVVRQFIPHKYHLSTKQVCSLSLKSSRKRHRRASPSVN
jgi:hypothetical protein